MSFVKAIGLMSLFACLVACSSPGRNYTGSALVETLDIEIMPNTSKMFVYRLRLPEDRMANNVQIERGGFMGGQQGPRGIAISSTTPKRLQENTAVVVERMGYCREGFLEIDSSIAPYNMWMKGECKEGATEEDIKRFGSKQSLPVKLAK